MSATDKQKVIDAFELILATHLQVKLIGLIAENTASFCSHEIKPGEIKFIDDVARVINGVLDRKNTRMN